MLTILSYLPITDATWIFFTVLCIILFAPMLMSKLKIPHIIGMVLAGVIVGPYGLNILERDASFGLFGQVGLYYIMFLAGLEMDMEGLKKNYHRMVFFGLLLTSMSVVHIRHSLPTRRSLWRLPHELLTTGTDTAELCYGVKHPYSLPHRLQIRSATPPLRNTQRGSVDDGATVGATGVVGS